jgi:hypothetical protein
MKTDDQSKAPSSDVDVREPIVPERHAQPSPELASFLELLGRALAQEWIDQTTIADSRSDIKIVQ